MARYRRRTPRRRATPRRSYRKRFVRKTRYSKKGQKLYLFKRNVNGGTFNADAVLEVLGALTFRLSDCPNYTEFTALYDMYKINAIKISFIPQMTVNNSLSSVNNPQNARFFTCFDYNDNTVPTNIDAIRQYQSCKYTTLLRTHKRYIYKPKILDSSSYNMSPWIATTSPNTNYYGIKYGVEPMGSTVITSMLYRVEAKFYLSFRVVK